VFKTRRERALSTMEAHIRCSSCARREHMQTYRIQGLYGHGKPGKVMEFKNCLFSGLEKSFEKKPLSQKVLEMLL